MSTRQGRSRRALGRRRLRGGEEEYDVSSDVTTLSPIFRIFLAVIFSIVVASVLVYLFIVKEENRRYLRSGNPTNSNIAGGDSKLTMPPQSVIDYEASLEVPSRGVYGGVPLPFGAPASMPIVEVLPPLSLPPVPVAPIELPESPPVIVPILPPAPAVNPPALPPMAIKQPLADNKQPGHACTNWATTFIATQREIFTSFHVEIGEGPSPAMAATCPSAAVSHVSFMESWRNHPAASEGVLQHVQEIAINFDLVEETLIYGGMGELGGSSVHSGQLAALTDSFKTSVRAETLPELQAALGALKGPAFFVFGPLRPGECDPPLAVERTMLAMRHKFGPKSAMVFSGPAHYYGVGSSECAKAAADCHPTSLDIAATICAVAPKMSQGMYKGVMRVTPEVIAPWLPKIPVPVIPGSLWNGYTVGGKIPIGNFYIQELVNIVSHPVTKRPTTAPVAGREGVVTWDAAKIANFEGIAKARGQAYYDVVDPRLYALLDRHPVKGKTVVIMGSLEPFYELVFMTFGALKVTTIEYGVRLTTDPRFEVLTPAKMKATPRKFDVAVSISSFEHDGLGRYGDPLDPDGDLKIMKYLRDTLLKPGGALFLAMPSGGDFIEFNAHRIYGKVRFPMLTAGWKLEDSQDFKEDIWNNGGAWQMQPVYYLTTPL